jgi:SSS family solute:Na+ symporter
VAALTHGLTVAEGKGGWIANTHEFLSPLAQNYWIAIFSWTSCLLMTIAVSLVTKPKPESELRNLVYGFTDIPPEETAPWYKRPGPLAIVVIAVLVALNIIYW